MQSFNLEQTSPSALRAFFQVIVREGLQGCLFSPNISSHRRGEILSFPVEVSESYFYCLCLCRELVNQLPDVSDVRYESSLVWTIMHNDLKTIPLPVALAAWLTVDDWRWEQEFPMYSDELSSLSYGLVQKPYTQAVCMVATFVVGFLQTQMDRTPLFLPPYTRLISPCGMYASNLYKSLPQTVKSECWNQAVVASGNQYPELCK